MAARLQPKGVNRVLLQFALGAIPAGATVTSTTLSLHAWADDSGSGQHASLSFSDAAWIERVVEPWALDSVTWDSQPSSSEEARVALPESTAQVEDYLDSIPILRGTRSSPSPTASHCARSLPTALIEGDGAFVTYIAPESEVGMEPMKTRTALSAVSLSLAVACAHAPLRAPRATGESSDQRTDL